MHARIDQLLSLRDGAPVEAAVAEHVKNCATCSCALADLAALRDRLVRLPCHDGPEPGWALIQQRIRQRARSADRTRRVARGLVAASLAVLAFVASLPWLQRGPTPDPALATREPAVVSTSIESAEIERLRAQSAALESVLAALPRPAVQRAGTSVPIATLEAQVQWLDHRLSSDDVAGASPALERQLWRERVDVMNSLVRLRYAEAQRVVM